jgi:hypothetical protein
MLNKIFNFAFAGKAGMWTAIFTAVLTLFTALLYQVSKDATDTQRNSQRALLSFNNLSLGVRNVSGTTTPDLSGKWLSEQIFVNFVNSGDTPTGAVVLRTSIHDWPEDLPKGYQFPLDGEKINATVGPKAPYADPGIIPVAMLAETWKGQAHLFVWGDVAYRDIFPNDPERLSEFCVEITHVTVGWIVPPQNLPGKSPAVPSALDAPNVQLTGFQWQPCKEHNCYDEDCSDYSDAVKNLAATN